MKKIIMFLSIISLLKFSSSVAQSSDFEEFGNNIKTGVGPAFIYSGDVSGFMQYTQYSRGILPNLQVSAGFSLAQLSSTSEYWVQMALKTLDLNISLIPIRSNRHNLKIGTGISLLNTTNVFGVRSNSREGNTFTEYGDYYREEYNSIGLTALMEYEYQFLGRWIIGSRTSYQYYIFGTNVLFLGINGGIRF